MKILLVPFYVVGYLVAWAFYVLAAAILFFYSVIEFIAKAFWDAVLDDSRRVIEHPLDEDYLRSEWD